MKGITMILGVLKNIGLNDLMRGQDIFHDLNLDRQILLNLLTLVVEIWNTLNTFSPEMDLPLL